jgi:hypothetical protein
VVAAVLVTVAVGCAGGDDDDAGPVTFDSRTAGDFYTPPDPLPEGKPGTLLRFEPLDEQSVAGATAYRVMYLSESVGGEPIAVTGTVVVPEGDAPAGGWKLISVAHGTSGNADECAPSTFFADAPVLALDAPIAAGTVVAVTDYEGIGTPGRHPYLVAGSEGRSVIDAARAARQLPGVPVDDRYGVVGYSQGGHAAGAAHDIAADWAPELELVGTVAGAPPSETDVIFTASASLGNAPDAFFLMVAGFAEAYPSADPALVLTDAGLEVLAGVDRGCNAIADAIGVTPWADLVRLEGPTTEPWATLLQENRVGLVAADSPILIAHSADDTGVPVFLAETMSERLCGLGQVVELRVYDEGEDHDAAAASKTGEMFAWVDARFAGEPASSTC